MAKTEPRIITGTLPTMTNLVSQLVTQNQLEDPVYDAWVERIREPKRMHRKQWEWVYILQALSENGYLVPGMSGVGFGVGDEPVPAVLAQHRCRVLATEINIEQAHADGWVKGRDPEAQMIALNDRGICDDDRFRSLVSYRDLDMNHIPADLTGFDFTWSCCALEHLGTLKLARDYVFNCLRCIKPGGLAVHTTEYSTARWQRIEEGSTIFFRKQDVIELARDLVAEGHGITLNLHKGSGKLDRSYDWAPYRKDNHLKLRVSKRWRFIGATSIGLIIRKAG